MRAFPGDNLSMEGNQNSERRMIVRRKVAILCRRRGDRHSLQSSREILGHDPRIGPRRAQPERC